MKFIQNVVMVCRSFHARFWSTSQDFQHRLTVQHTFTIWNIGSKLLGTLTCNSQFIFISAFYGISIIASVSQICAHSHHFTVCVKVSIFKTRDYALDYYKTKSKEVVRCISEWLCSRLNLNSQRWEFDFPSCDYKFYKCLNISVNEYLLPCCTFGSVHVFTFHKTMLNNYVDILRVWSVIMHYAAVYKSV